MIILIALFLLKTNVISLSYLSIILISLIPIILYAAFALSTIKLNSYLKHLTFSDELSAYLTEIEKLKQRQEKEKLKRKEINHLAKQYFVKLTKENIEILRG